MYLHDLQKILHGVYALSVSYANDLVKHCEIEELPVEQSVIDKCHDKLEDLLKSESSEKAVLRKAFYNLNTGFVTLEEDNNERALKLCEKQLAEHSNDLQLNILSLGNNLTFLLIFVFRLISSYSVFSDFLN